MIMANMLMTSRGMPGLSTVGAVRKCTAAVFCLIGINRRHSAPCDALHGVVLMHVNDGAFGPD